jgi:hypothetical protein
LINERRIAKGVPIYIRRDKQDKDAWLSQRNLGIVLLGYDVQEGDRRVKCR